MSLSDWDVLAFREDKKPSLARFWHPGGSELYLEENNLILHNKEEDLLVQIQEGTIFHEDIIVNCNLAKDGNTLFFVATYYDELGDDEDKEDYEEEIDGGILWEDRYYFHILAGLTTPGYPDELNVLLNIKKKKLSPEQLREAKVGIKYGKRGGYYQISYPDSTERNKTRYLRIPITDAIKEELREYQGTSIEIYFEFLEWLEDVVRGLDELVSASFETPFYQSWFEEILLKEPVRYNQGDSFFNSEYTIEEVSSSVIGKANPPIIEEITKLFSDLD